MAGIDFSQPILGAGASAKTDFAAAQARTGLSFTGDARFKRGIKAELGVEAFANASAELSKFVHASIEGTAFARARAGLQLQLPLNLFDEFGFSARAEAIAEAAAGVEVALGLSIGDFVLLAKRDPNLIGLPLEMLLLFLEEVSIGGSFEVNVSASAKAHASVSVAGTIIEKAGDKAGFYYTIDAGVGLAAGVGMGFKAGAEFRDFRRFFGRAVDKSVDTAIQEIIKLIPSDLKLSANQDALNPWFEAFSPVAKIALRIAYDVGLKIAENNPGHSQNNTAILCDEAIKTFLEESQRFIFNKILESGIDSIRKLLEQKLPILPTGKWDDPAVVQCRTDLAGKLLAMPAEPFQDSQENLNYWKELIEKAINLVISINDPDPKLTEAISIIYCTSELLMQAIRAKVNSASAYATAIGAGTVNTDTQPFKGQLNAQPALQVGATIRSVIGGNGALTYPDLVQFLVNDIIVNNVLATFPELNRFMNIFKNDFSKTENEILKLLLQNASSFDLANPNAAQVDSHALLKLIVHSIDKFLAEKFKADILPQILNNVSDPNLKLYIEEVLFEAVVYMKDVGLNTILNWDKVSFDNDDFTEALAGVMILLLGRTVVIVADTFITATQEQIQDGCNDVSARIRNFSDNPASNDDGIQHIIPYLDPDLIKLTADCVKIGGMVLGPLKDDTRKRVRNLLYQVFEPIPPGKEQDFLTSLGDDFFIPSVDQLQQVTNELKNISKDRFIQFVEQFILRVGEYILEKLEELILAIIDLVMNWEKHLANALLAIATFLRDIENTIRALNQQLINLLETATEALHNLFQTLGSATLKNRIKNDIKDNFVDKALDALEDVDIYRVLPSDQRREIRALANGAVNAVIDNPFIQPVFNAISELSNQLDDLLPDVRELNPNDNLPEQFMLLILDKIENNIRNHFGGSKPHISPEIDFSYRVWVYDPPISGHWETHHIYIPLGRIEINLSPFIDIVRNAIQALNFYHNALNDTCFKLGNALATELELAAKQLEHDTNKADSDRLDKINAEHNNDPKEIAILTPLSLTHYTNAIDVKIHLGGVPMAYLGLAKDEIQRVLIYINGELIPPKSLIVEESKLNSKNDEVHLRDFEFKNLISIDNKTGKALNSFDSASGIIKTAKASIITDTSLHYPVQEINKEVVNSGTQYIFSNSKLKEQPVSKSVYKTPVTNFDSGNLYVERTSKTIDKGKGKGNLVHNYDIKNNLPGRGISAGKINNLLKERMPGLLIQFKIELDEPFIVEGVNVLTVVVIERGGNRHQQNVSFTVSHEPVSKKPVPGILNVVNPNTGKTETAIMTLDNVISQFNSVAKKGNISMKDYLASVGKGAITKTEPQKTKLIPVENFIESQIKKRETVVVIQKDEKGGEKQIGKPILLEYSSNSERKEKLIKQRLSNIDLVEDSRRLKTISVTYEKSLSVLTTDKKEIKVLKQVSTSIKREDFDVLDKKGNPVKKLQIEYSSADERKSELEKLKLDIKLLRTSAISTEEKISINDDNDKSIQIYYKSSKALEFELNKIKNYKPNVEQDNKLKDEVKSAIGIDAKEAIIIQSQKINEDKKIEIKINPISNDLLSQRINSAKDYLVIQDQLNLK